MARTEQIRDRETTAARLLTSSARSSFDPDLDVDWDAPLVEGKPFMPLERTSLYGTELWQRLSDEQRIELSKHEIASIMSVGLWFEICLMQALTRYAYDRDPRSAHAQYALTEIGDETRHSVMFARAVEKLGVPRYGPSRAIHNLARLFNTTAAGPSMFGSVLVAEETLDRLQRSMMDDENIQPLIRAINRIHVVEEARHVRYAKEAISRTMPKLGPAARHWHRFQTALVSYFVVDSLIDPNVYAAVGIDPQEGRRAALANPHYQDTRRWMGEKIMPFLREEGLVGGAGMPLWRRAHLV
ncbi:para-aminobenzoate N-oxygenase AurF [Halopolyspora algeriensis]|uniref:Para-aminobenzoate N-oxygenase AurF n=1 Tax=Halopolyspora algeriensis TaxID=1500506 RepID=A0A368VUX3_9ACTN|nr:diiron oxygenase [Halopolyspora algeriensis]RCW45896.1 para-aminobenzoate N-oxygenase AurF [Halopolyspora algeriensis]TQM55310.1 para-aminobenzoate N-oxygenase AurF [Halopolyspora algeriensis]